MSDDELAYGERLLRWADPTTDEGDDSSPVCEFCGLEVENGESDYPPFCSASCEQAAGSETYASVHPRPEEVG